MSFKSAIDAGAYVHKFLEKGGWVLFKGSQGGIYLEEGIKVVLHSTEEESRLVRQSLRLGEKNDNFFEPLVLYKAYGMLRNREIALTFKHEICMPDEPKKKKMSFYQHL